VVAERQSFADHHAYTATEARILMAHADDQNLVLITTEKDQARLSGNPKLAALAARTLVLPVRLVVEEEEAFRQMVLKVAKR